MAQFGLAHPVWAPITSYGADKMPVFGRGRIIGKENLANWTPTVATASFPADNYAAHQRSVVVGGTIDTTLDDIAQADLIEMFGGVVVDGEWRRGGVDQGAYGGFGYITANEDTEGNEYFEAFVYYKTKGAPTAEAANTQGDSLTYTGVSVQLSVYNLGDEKRTYRGQQRFPTEAAAIAWLENKLNVSEAYLVEITKTGEGEVDPVGPVYVTAGGELEISISGTPTAVYDNGADVKESVTNDKYTLSGVAADHEIVVIY